MIRSALAAVEEIASPPFRAIFLKSLGLTLAILAIGVIGLERLVVLGVHFSAGWLTTLVHVAAGAGLVAAAIFLVPTIAFVVAGFFFDEMAAHVEAAGGAEAIIGRAMPIGPALWIGLKFSVVSLVVYAAALALLLIVPGVNAAIFFGANAYLLGRGFFELAALRYVTSDEMRALRARHGARIFLAGCVVAGLTLVPIVNLVTPLFATAFLVRVTQPLVRPFVRRRIAAARGAVDQLPVV